MKKQESFTETKEPQRGSYMSFSEDIFQKMFGNGDMFYNVTPGKKYKLTNVVFVNFQSNERNFKFIDNRNQEQVINSNSNIMNSIKFFDMTLVPTTGV
jgi:hypothetical protein